MDHRTSRRAAIAGLLLLGILSACAGPGPATRARAYNGPYEGTNLDRVAFPIGTTTMNCTGTLPAMSGSPQ